MNNVLPFCTFYIGRQRGPITVMLLAALLLMPFAGFAQFAGGSGTAADPYQVSNVTQLQAIRNAANNAHFILINDIDASATAGWNGGQGFEPIGWFNGTVNGNGYTITNLVINRPGSSDIALFTQLGSSGVVKNVALANINISGRDNTAAVAATLNGLIDNVSVTGSISGINNVGGIVGQPYTNSQIRFCNTEVDVVGVEKVGGLIGHSNGAIVTGCHASGSVSGTNEVGGLIGHSRGSGSSIQVSQSSSSSEVDGANRVGGLIGHFHSGTMEKSHSSGLVKGNNQVGGLIGFFGDSGSQVVKSSSSTAEVEATGDQVGGFIGFMQGGTVDGCQASGKAEGRDQVGGLIGYIATGTIDRSSFHSGSVQGRNKAGGLIGAAEGWGLTLKNSYAISSVTGSGNQIGGLIGIVKVGTIENCMSGGSVSGNDDIGGFIGNSNGPNITVRISYSTSDVTSNGDNAGGFIGNLDGGHYINTFARGNVTARNFLGGHVGRLGSGTIDKSYSTGFINKTSPGRGQRGGFAGGPGNVSSSVSNSFYDQNTSGENDTDKGGTPRTTQEMKTQSTFTDAGWDFTNIWSMDPNINDGYPYLFPLPDLDPDPDPDEFEWTGEVNTAWENGGNWTMERAPMSNEEITIPDVLNKPIISSDVVIEGITIMPGSSLTVGTSGSLTVNGTLDNQAGTSGLVIASGAGGTGSFIYHGTTSGTFQRYIGSSERWQMLSSPVSNQSIDGGFTPSGSYGDGTGYDFYAWHEPDTMWMYLLEPTWPFGGSFNVGQGYLVSYQQPDTKAFSGNFNSGEINIEVSRTMGESPYFGNNLIGNPYPSSIDWKADGWELNGVLQSIGGGHDIYIWDEGSNNYGVYNSASSVDTGTLGVSRYIAPTQGFFIMADITGSISMNNSVRVHEGADNWIKSGPETIPPLKNQLVVRLESVDGHGNDEVVLEFGHETEKSSPKLFSFIETAPSLYLPRHQKDYSIRLLRSPEHHPVVPVSFAAGVDGEYRIRAHFHDELSEMVVLEDLQTGQRHDLIREGDYVFFSSTGDKPGRFMLRFREGNYANPHARLPVSAYAFDTTLAVDLRLVDATNICQVEVFDVLGRRVFENRLAGSTLYELPLSHLQGAYVVQISTRNAVWSGKVVLMP